MKAFSAPLIEAIAFFLALSFAMIAYSAYKNSAELSIKKSIENCEGKCYEGFIPYSKEELEDMNITVIGEGSYGVIYLNENSSLIARLR